VALCNPAAGVLELSLSVPLVEPGGPLPIWDIAGVSHGPEFKLPPSSDNSSIPEYSRASFGMAAFLADVEMDWALKVDSDDIHLELSPYSDLLYFADRHQSSLISLKYSGRPFQPSDASSIITGVMFDFLTDLDLVYGIRTQPALPEAPTMVQRSFRDQAPFEFSGANYSRVLKDLYWYATNARAFPLLQYLAYYQVLESSFSPLNTMQVAGRLTILLADPNFDLSDDRMVSDLIGVTAAAHRGFNHEKAQLRTAVEMLVSSDDLRRVFEDNDFAFSNEDLPDLGLERINLDSHRVWDHLANRIYTLRNRIVHSNDEDATSAYARLIPDDSLMKPIAGDVELIRWVAQKALIFSIYP
jgi:hypothetical protein